MVDILKKVPAYDEESIKHLSGREAVRLRPGMYLGNTEDGTGLHHTVWEIVDNSVDEAQEGHCSRIVVTLNTDGSVSVADNGRGIPVGINKQSGRNSLELAMTELHAGGKFDSSNYKSSGGLHGVGASVVNFLSKWMKVEVWRDGKSYVQEYETGIPKTPVQDLGKTKFRGTKVTFLPDPEIFRIYEFNFQTILDRLQIISFLNQNLQIIARNKATGEEKEYLNTQGLTQFFIHRSKGKKAIHEACRIVGEQTIDNKLLKMEVVLGWTEAYSEDTVFYTNNIPNRDGGTHQAGFKAGITRTLNKWIDENNLLTKKQKELELSGDDFREGLVCILSLKLPDPKFSSQTKEKLVSNEAKGFVETFINDKFYSWLNENPKHGKKIVDKILQAATARDAARKARESVRKQTNIDTILDNAGKIAHCQSKNPEECEVFIVEGDSAGGICKQGRDRRVQAVLPLKGKVLNVEKASISKLLENKELASLVTALGCGIGDIFDIKDLRYHKIIIMCDADSDGKHISALLLTFFYRYMPQLLEGGYVYIGQPPLFRMVKGKEEAQYFLKDEELEEFLRNKGFIDIKLEKGNRADHFNTESELMGFLKSKNLTKEQARLDGYSITQEGSTRQAKEKGYNIQRFKGLGEMNADQLAETCLDPETRILKQVMIPDKEKADVVFELLMGSEVEARRNFIMENFAEAKNLDY